MFNKQEAQGPYRSPEYHTKIYNFGKKLYFLSKYLFSINKLTLQKMSFICFTHTHWILCLTPPWGQNLYPDDIFGRGLPALHHHVFSFSYIHVENLKFTILVEAFLFDITIHSVLILGTFCPALSQGLGGGGRTTMFTIFVPLHP
jgi:hypothetical protein